MNPKKVIYISFIFCLFNLFCFGRIFSYENVSRNLVETLKQIDSVNWKKKDETINKIKNIQMEYPDSDRIVLIDIFDTEIRFQDEYVNNLKNNGYSANDALNKFYEEHGKKGYIKYFSNFANLISSLKDIKAIPSLLRGIKHYGGAVVPSHIINIGSDAVNPLIELLNSRDVILRTMAFSVLAIWVNAPIIGEEYSVSKDMSIKDSNLLDRIKNAFLKALHDEDIDVRSSVVYGLKAFPEKIVLQKLEDVFKSDPYSFYSTYEKKIIYPIREDARRSIEIIKERIRNNSSTE